MEIDSFLIERFAFHSGESGEEIKEYAENGKEHHAFVADFGGLLDSFDGFNDKMDGADYKKTGDDKTPDDGIFFAFFAFEEVGDAGGDGVGKTMEGIGGDGSRISNKATDKLDNRKS